MAYIDCTELTCTNPCTVPRKLCQNTIIVRQFCPGFISLQNSTQKISLLLFKPQYLNVFRKLFPILSCLVWCSYDTKRTFFENAM